MYPVLFRIGELEITSFGVMVALGALVGWRMFARELRLSGLPAAAADAGLYGVVGGLVGAKLLWVIEHLGEEPIADLLFARGGLSWYGGLAGGLGAGLAYIALKTFPSMPVVAAATPALAIGHLIGRIGCFLVGDDYGRPSDLPWAVAFPDGLPPTTARVHPTQLYEAAVLAILATALMRWRRRGLPDRVVVARYLAIAGSARFLIEFVRVNERVALGLTTAQWASLGMLVLAGVLSRVPSVAQSRRGREGR